MYIVYEEEDNAQRQHDITPADGLPEDNLTGRQLNSECKLELDTGDQEVTCMVSNLHDQELAFGSSSPLPIL